jgi:hypothetical protein
MKSAFITAIKAFVSTVKSNHLEYCQKVVAKHEQKTTKKDKQ